MVVSWRRERYEKQIIKAATTIRRMRHSRIMRKVEAKLWGMNVELFIRRIENETTDRTADYKNRFQGAYYVLKRYGHCTNKLRAEAIFNYAKKITS